MAFSAIPSWSIFKLSVLYEARITYVELRTNYHHKVFDFIDLLTVFLLGLTGFTNLLCCAVIFDFLAICLLCGAHA